MKVKYHQVLVDKIAVACHSKGAGLKVLYRCDVGFVILVSASPPNQIAEVVDAIQQLVKTEDTGARVVDNKDAPEDNTALLRVLVSEPYRSRVSVPRSPKSLRFDVFRRDGFTCQYCGRKAPEVVLHCDHVMPKSKGGSTAFENLVTSCSDCNLGKSNKLLSDDAIPTPKKAIERDCCLWPLPALDRRKES